MITDAQFAAWLNDSTAQRVARYRIGVNVGGVEKTIYLTSKALINNPAATPYVAAIASGLKMTQAISISGEATLSTSDIEVFNVAGERDAWYSYVFANRSFEVDIGDVRWPDADFRLYYVGTVADIDPKAPRDRIRLQLRDMLQVLHAPVTEEKLAGDVLRLATLGEVANITPKLKSASPVEYEVHGGAIEDVIEVRVDGKKRTDITKSLAAGSFTFTGNVGPGAVTCSAQGDKPAGVYSNTIAKLVQRLVTGYGKASDRLTADDIDTANFAAFDLANSQPVGLHLSDRENVIVACAKLASSKGAQLVPSRLGKLRLIQFTIPASATTEIRQSAQVDRSIHIVDRIPVAGAVKVGGCRNYTVQPSLQTSLPDAHKALFATEWRTYTAKDQPTLDKYKLTADPAMRETCLQDDADIQAEAERVLAIVKVSRFTYGFEGTPANMLLDIGQAVKLFSNRFELATGKVGLVTKLATDLDNFHVDVEVTA